MEVAPLPSVTPKESFCETFDIKQDQKKYKLTIAIINQNISLILSEDKAVFEKYEINLNFSELKQIHSAFSMLISCQDFLDYIKALIKNNKLKIKKELQNVVSIEIIVEYLFKQNTIKIDLKPKALELESIVKDMFKQLTAMDEKLLKVENNYFELEKKNKNLKDENRIIKEENKEMKDKINNLQKSLDDIKSELNEIKNEKKAIKTFKEDKLDLDASSFKINSAIMKDEEFDMIKKNIEEIMKLKIKKLNKIYQATIDGGESSDFHRKCDGIENTLVLFESRGNRRFGGFTSSSWESKKIQKADKNCFLFSLDNKKIFSIKDDKYFKIDCYPLRGPSFLHQGTYCIELYKNAFNKDGLRTVESIHENIFGREENILSEDGHYNGVPSKDYEVFKIMFY